MCSCRYASLYFCCAIEEHDNELITLEVIHRFVELLDKYFGSVSDASQHVSVFPVSVHALIGPSNLSDLRPNQEIVQVWGHVSYGQMSPGAVLLLFNIMSNT